MSSQLSIKASLPYVDVEHLDMLIMQIPASADLHPLALSLAAGCLVFLDRHISPDHG